MSIRFILGRAGSGKSEQCLGEIRMRLQGEPDGAPLILIVPEQATFQAEYALVTTPGLKGMLRAQVLSFRRLAYRVMQETGGAARIHLDETGKKMLLYKTIRSCTDRLRLFGRQMEQVGFIDKLNEMLSELKRYRITADRLREIMDASGHSQGTSGILLDKLHDLHVICQEFEGNLASRYNDAEDMLERLAKHVGLSRYIGDAEIWIDGFNGFTPQEYAVIEQLMQKAKRVNIALCLDREYGPDETPDELDLFYPTAATMIRLAQMAARLGIAKEETLFLQEGRRFAECPMLGHLEKHFTTVLPWRDKHSESGSGRFRKSGIELYAAVHRRAEVEGAAREIIRLVREEQYRWRDIAVMIRNPEAYQDLLTIVFTDYEIPYFFDMKRTVLHHPLIEFIRSALEAVRYHWRYDAVFRCVKTGLMCPPDEQPGLPWDEKDWRRGMDLLENYVLAYGIQGTKWTNPEAWNYPCDFPEQIHICREQVVRPLSSFQSRLQKAKTAAEMTEALYLLLTDVGAPQHLEHWHRKCIEDGYLEKAKEHAQIWDRTMDVLDQLTELLGDEPLTLDLFAEMVETGLESLRMAHVPPALDQVLVGSMERTRSGAKKCCLILGVNDGVLPFRGVEDGILTEGERERLLQSGLELAPGSRRRLLDEQFLIYTSLCTPSRRLWVSYPLADEEGRALLPSEVVRKLKRMFPDLKEGHLPAEPSPEMDEEEQKRFIVHPSRAVTYLILQLRRCLQGEPLAEPWREVYHWLRGHPVWRERLRLLVGSLTYANREETLTPETSRNLYGSLLRTSVSRMETFAGCPFAHFAAYGLMLKERKIYRLEAPDIGQLFHAALRLITEQVNAEGLDWGMLSEEKCMQLAETAVDRLSPRLQGEILLSSHRYQYIARKLKEVVGKTTMVLGRHAKRSSFVPVGWELAFGPGTKLPPLTFTLSNGCRMEVVGRIDRVDKAETGGTVLLRVIDYKSGDTPLRLEEIFYGLSLQMLTYLDVILTHAREWLGTEAKPAGILYFRVHNPVLNVTHFISREKLEDMRMKQFRMKGLVTADEEVIRQMDETLTSGPSQIIPVALSKEGGFWKTSSVATWEQWEQLRRFVRRKILGLGERITAGKVEIRPFQLGKKTACEGCSYKPVCQFDPLLEGNRYRLLKRKEPENLWRWIAQWPEKEAEDDDWDNG